MTAKTNKRTMVVAYSRTPWRPYRGSFSASGDAWIAVTIPGGFSGFGDTSDAAISMARARAVTSMRRAKAHEVGETDWWRGMTRRISPSLFGLLKSLNDRQDLGEYNGLHFEGGPSDTLPTMPRSELQGCG